MKVIIKLNNFYEFFVKNNFEKLWGLKNVKIKEFFVNFNEKINFYFYFSALKLSNYYATYRPGINEKQSQNKVRQMAKSQKSFWIVNKNGIKLN